MALNISTRAAGLPGPAAPRRRALPRLGSALDLLSRAVVVFGFLASIPLFLLTACQHQLGYHSYEVLSGSMVPTMPIGSLVISHPEPAAEIRVGDIVTFHPPAEPRTLVTHRVYAILDGPGGRQFVTKGDANQAPDRWRVPATGMIDREVRDVPRAGYISDLLQSPRARLLFLFLPGCLLCLVVLVQLWRPEAGEGERTRP